MLIVRALWGFPVVAVLGLLGCNELKMESGDLTARSPEAQRGLDCAVCHPYVLKDSNHVFHLFDQNFSGHVNGPITCLDCHATAIQSRAVPFPDTLYTYEGSQYHSLLDFPFIDDPVLLADVRSRPIDSIDTVVWNRPIPAPARPGPPPDSNLVEGMTGLAHMNGKVDVAFDPRVTDEARFADDSLFPVKRATFSPTQETCSAIACHPVSGDPWRFGAPSKGLSGIKH